MPVFNYMIERNVEGTVRAFFSIEADSEESALKALNDSYDMDSDFSEFFERETLDSYDVMEESPLTRIYP